ASLAIPDHPVEALDQYFDKMRPHVPPDLMTEMDALADAAHVPRAVIYRVNVLLDRLKVAACSAFLTRDATTRDVVVARNLDFPAMRILHRHVKLFVVRPTGKPAFVD